MLNQLLKRAFLASFVHNNDLLWCLSVDRCEADLRT